MYVALTRLATIGLLAMALFAMRGTAWTDDGDSTPTSSETPITVSWELGGFS